jgi:RNA polymerase sigma-70 factor (ECF subfamily)
MNTPTQPQIKPHRTAEFIPTRKSLLTRLKNWDDQEGWREFFDTYWKLIYSVAIKAGFSDAEAQDIVQDTIVIVARKMRGFHYDPAIGSFKAWLLLNTRSRIAERLRRKRLPIQAGGAQRGDATARTATIERIADPGEQDLDALWDAEWKQNLLEQAIEAVKLQVAPKQFQIFDLYVLQEVPIETITRSLNVNTAQVYLAKHRVSKLLKNELKKLEKKLDIAG